MQQTASQPFRLASIICLAVVVTVLPLSAATPAHAEGECLAVVFAEPSSRSAEYGEAWLFGFTAPSGLENHAPVPVTSTGTPTGYMPSSASYFAPGGIAGYVSTAYEAAPLKVGDYTFSVEDEANYVSPCVSTAMPAHLTVTPAKLGVELRIVPDPANGDAAIVTARFTGRFIDEYSSSFYPGAPQSPAGIWNITIRDSDGEVATERSSERAAGDDVLATSFYWDDAEPGEQYTASAQFTPGGASAANFAITQASDFDYTAAEAQRPVPTSTATAEPDTSLPEATGFSLPLWLLIVVGGLILGLGALLTVLSIRLSRRSTAANQEAAA